MPGLKIAIEGRGKFFWMCLRHVGTRFPRATIYDRSAAATAFRKAEADLGRRGFLDAEGQRMARRISHSLDHPPEDDSTVAFTQDSATVTCRNGKSRTIKLYLTGLDDNAVARTFFNLDAAITQCTAASV